MKKIVKGNDFTLRIPVVKMVSGEKVAFPLPSCTDLTVRVCSAYRRYELAHTVDAAEDNVILAKVEGDTLSLGTYAVEVRGKIFGNDWRSNEYPQFQIVNENADADTEFSETDEGDDSVEMDTAVVFMPPTAELSSLINEAEGLVTKADEAVTNAEKAVAGAENIDVDINGADLEITRKSGEKKGFNLLLLKGDKGEKGEKGDKGDAFTYADFTQEQITALQKPATDAASKVDEAVSEAEAALKGLEVQGVSAEAVEMEANKYYDITLASTNTLTLTLKATADTTHAHDYEGGFDADDTTAPTVTWPEGVTWADMPTLKAAMHYEFSIREVGTKKYGVIYAWSKS